MAGVDRDAGGARVLAACPRPASGRPRRHRRRLPRDSPGTRSTFWQAVTGYEVASSDETGSFLKDPDKQHPGVYLQVVPEPKIGKNRVHLDLFTGDLEGELTRIKGLGASEVKRHDGWVVLADSDGNQFCVVAA
ncbi:MAG: VOC family protein [Micromonosporaceae bacterium]